jgi:cytochrome c553
MPNGFWLTVLMVLSALLVVAGIRARRIRRLSLRITAMAVLAILSISAVSASVMAIAGIIKASSRNAPIPEVRVAGNPEQIARGAVIADSFCGACHTQSSPLTGGMDIGKHLAAPVGSFVSSNLTPAGLLSHWTDGEIFRAIRNGVDAQGNWLTIMTYTNVNHLSDADIVALIAYLRSRPASGAPTENPPDHFNLLGLMMLGAGMLPACHGEKLTGGVPGQSSPTANTRCCWRCRSRPTIRLPGPGRRAAHRPRHVAHRLNSWVRGAMCR